MKHKITDVKSQKEVTGSSVIKKKRGRPPKKEISKLLKEQLGVADSKESIKSMPKDEILSIKAKIKKEKDELYSQLATAQIKKSFLDSITNRIALNDVVYMVRGNVEKISNANSSTKVEIKPLLEFLKDQLKIFKGEKNGFIRQEVNQFLKELLDKEK